MGPLASSILKIDCGDVSVLALQKEVVRLVVGPNKRRYQWGFIWNSSVNSLFFTNSSSHRGEEKVSAKPIFIFICIRVPHLVCYQREWLHS